ncbi:MAG TPA: TetR/AcrR family transcriptional regulator [Ktedonobacteraceae bacterium]|nr:TetR/AcrR family transcriptional regulator [Ktedonobacteraceae bacterium]
MKHQQTEGQAEHDKAKNAGRGRRQRLTQQAIVAAAAELFARKGFGATSLDDIAEVLGASKASLYYHIKNKEEILRLIFLTVLTVSEEPLRTIVESELTPQEKLCRAIEHQTAVAADRSPAMTVFYREQPHLTGPFAREIILRKKVYERYFERIIVEGQQTGSFLPEVDAKIAAFGLLGMCNWLSQWYSAGGHYTPRQVAAMFERMLGQGLLVKKV